MPADGAREHEALEIASAGNKIVNLIAVRDAGHVLLDDGAVVEDLGDVVAGGADEFDAARVSCVVGFGSGEGGQKRVVHVDDLCPDTARRRRGKDLHVAGQDDEVDSVALEQVELAGSAAARVGAGRRCVEGDAVEAARCSTVRWLETMSGISQASSPVRQRWSRSAAVEILRAEEGDAGPAERWRYASSCGVLRPPGQRRAGRHRDEGPSFYLFRLLGLGSSSGPGFASLTRRSAPTHAHKEEAEFVILMLVGVQDVGSVLVKAGRRHERSDPAVGAVDEKDGSVFHAPFSLIHHLQWVSRPGVTRQHKVASPLSRR